MKGPFAWPSSGRIVASPRGGARAALLGTFLVVATALAFPVTATPHFDTGYYTHDGCPASNYDRIDPINMVFYSWGTWDRAASQIQSHASWYNQSGSPQSFVDHGNCYDLSTQRASGGNFASRFHNRLHPIHQDGILGWTTVGDAHHEDFIWYCGHAVDSNGSNGSGFDQGRRELRIRFEAAGHGWYSRYWGNTQNFRQCDGDWARSDGLTVFIALHQLNH